MVKAQSRESLLLSLRAAEIYFKIGFALAGALTVHKNSIPLWYPDRFSFGKHIATRSELELKNEDMELAPGILEHVSTYLCTVQIDTVLKSIFPNRFNHPDDEIRSASWIARLIRNAFAHDPFAPTWIIDRKCRSEVLTVANIIEMKPKILKGKPVKRLDYGGPISILRFLEWTMQIIRRQTSDSD